MGRGEARRTKERAREERVRTGRRDSPRDRSTWYRDRGQSSGDQMEEAAIATVQFLVRLLYPIALVAIGIGVLTIGFSGLARRRLEHVGERNFLPRSSAVEGAVVGVCAAISF